MAYDVVALGESLIDFIENERSEQDNSLFEVSLGDVLSSLLAMLQKLGYRTVFMGKVGKEVFGRMLGKLGIVDSGLR